MRTIYKLSLVLLGFIGLAGISRADNLTLDIYVGGNPVPIYTTTGASPVVGAVNLPGVVSGILTAGVTYTPNLSQLATTQLQLTNLSALTQTFTINTTDLTFLLPAPPSLLTSTLAVSSLTTPADLASNQVFLNGTQAGNTITVNSPSGTVVSTPVFLNTAGAVNLLSQTKITLAPGSSATLSVANNVVPVPEPSGALLAMSGAAVMLLRRRKR